MFGVASAASLAFSTAADYDNNFYEVQNPTELNWASSGGGRLVRGGTSSASIAIYNTTSTGGVSGSGGTSASALNNNIFNDLTIKMDFTPASLAAAGDSIGFYTRLNSTATAGYFVAFRAISTSQVDFRVFDSDANASIGSVGTLLSTQTISGAFTAGTAYTFQLNLTGAVFTGSVFAAGGGAQIGSSVSYTDTLAPLLTGGQVGIRTGTQSTTLSNYYDNFNVIPEPTSAALLGFGSLALIGRRKRNA